MVPIRYHVDPEGDVILVLSNPDAPFAPWDPKKNSTRAVKTESGLRFPSEFASRSTKADKDEDDTKRNDKQHATKGHKDVKNIERIGYRVSSKCLQFASRYFKTVFNPTWREILTEEGDLFIVNAQYWDQEVLLYLLRIIHYESDLIPYKLDREQLAKLAQLTYYYDCTWAIKTYTLVWAQRLPSTLNYENSLNDRELILHLYSAVIFRWDEDIRSLTASIMWRARGPMQTLGLFFPGKLTIRIDRERVEWLDKIADEVTNIMQSLKQPPPCREIACAVSRYGIFKLNLLCKNIHPKQLRTCKDGYSIIEVLAALERLQNPLLRPDTPASKHFACDLPQASELPVSLTQPFGGLKAGKYEW